MPCCGGLIASSKIHPLELKRATIIKLVHTISQSGKNADSILVFFWSNYAFSRETARREAEKKVSSATRSVRLSSYTANGLEKGREKRTRGRRNAFAKRRENKPPKNTRFPTTFPKRERRTREGV